MNRRGAAAGPIDPNAAFSTSGKAGTECAAAPPLAPTLPTSTVGIAPGMRATCSRVRSLPERIASPEMLPSVGLLPHLICSPPGFGGGRHEADQHGDTGCVGGGGGGAICPVHSQGSGPHLGRVRSDDGLAPQACDASPSLWDAQ